MRKSIYPVVLTEEERIFARGVVKVGKGSARVIRRANMLLMMDESTESTMKREDIAALLGVTAGTRLEIHHTPKHGSWLNIAECYLSVLSRECLYRRIPDLQLLASQLSAWNDSHDAAPAPINWRFSSPDARTRLRSLYPVIL